MSKGTEAAKTHHTEPVQTALLAIVKGPNRLQNTSRALSLIAEDIHIEDKHSILIKPNFVVTDNQLAATHADTVEAVLLYLRERTSRPIVIAESPAVGRAADGYSRYGFRKFTRKYGVRLMDLQDGEYIPVSGYNQRLEPLTLHVARIVAESDMRISVGPMKTHNDVIVTLSLKNMVVGSLRTKSAIHEGCQAVNLSLYKLAPTVVPHLSIIDAFSAMEGNGPGNGTAVNLKTVIAGTDFLAADTIATRIMGFDPHQVGYLHYCMVKGLGVSDLDRIEIRGEALSRCIGRPFKPHTSYERQLQWHVPNVEKLL